MPQTEVVMFAEEDGTCPFLVWLDEQPGKVQDKCIVRIERLAELGHELRRPEADTLRDGVHELLVSRQGVQYRILYFFVNQLAVVSHGLRKEQKIPDKDIDLALRRRNMFAKAPEKHMYRE